MIKKHKTALILSTICSLLPIVIGLILWNKLPAEVPMHWNLAGEVDRWGSKATLVFGMPSLIAAIQWLGLLATKADPKRNDIEDTKPFQIVFWFCPLLSLVMTSLCYAFALGHDISVETILPLFLGGTFLVIGNYLPKCKPSFTMGIKIPWTLASDENWFATHRFAGKVWMVCGAGIMLTSVLNSYVLFLVFALAMIILPVTYSYLFYRKHS